MNAILILRTYWKQLALAALVMVLFFTCWLASHYHAASVQLAKEKTDLQAQITSQQAIITKQIQQAQQFNSIAAGVESEKQQTTDAGEKVRGVYKTVLDRSPCARNIVDRDVADGLLNHASKVRSSTGDANPGKSDR
ncbi:DUF2800 domain-containing protein [Serratia marcescens]|uniref:DUF2800 domain-containing protein n=1 Tax=Serratia marcescens TaxID=615 RepID=UPI00101F93BB|nr:DUF2800 domain-containing protein [Serratia marcescens]CAI2110212.1 Uncharacterised protein [Serratia marcescens]